MSDPSFAKYNYVAQRMVSLLHLETDAADTLMAELASKYKLHPAMYDSGADDTQIPDTDAHYLRELCPGCTR